MSQKTSAMTKIATLLGSYKIPLGIAEVPGVSQYATDADQIADYIFNNSGLFWPLGGTADLTGGVTIDGNNFDLIFGSPNRLDDFQIYADNGILFDIDEGVDISSLSLTSDFTFLSTQSFNVDVDQNIGLISSVTSFQSSSQIVFTVDDGVDTNVLDIGPTLALFTGANFHASMSAFATLEADDGVDASSLSLTPTGGAVFDCPVGVGSYTVATLPSVGAARIIYVSDESGGPIIAFSDGTNWRRVTDGSIVS